MEKKLKFLSLVLAFLLLLSLAFSFYLYRSYRAVKEPQQKEQSLPESEMTSDCTESPSAPPDTLLVEKPEK